MIDRGHGEFSGVNTINELIGSDAPAEADAGAVTSAKAQAVVTGDPPLYDQSRGVASTG